jgi:hypothetical protein
MSPRETGQCYTYIAQPSTCIHCVEPAPVFLFLPDAPTTRDLQPPARLSWLVCHSFCELAPP